MTKRMEDMTRDEVQEEFKGGDIFFRVPRRPKKLVPLTLRVHPDLVRQLGEEAKRRGVSGHTTVARMLLEEAMAASRDTLADRIAEAVVTRLDRRRIANKR